MGANCNVTPQLKIFVYYRFDLTKKTPPQNFMGANCNITPQLKNFFYYRFDLTKKTPPSENFVGANCNITPQWKNHQHPAAHSRHNKNHVLPKRSTMLKSISCYWTNWFLWRAFLPTAREGNVFTGVCLYTIGLVATRSLLDLVIARLVRILLECRLVCKRLTLHRRNFRALAECLLRHWIRILIDC